MDILNIIILSIIQGVTEFLPISSSGHLVIIQSLLGINQPGNDFEVLVHIGTLGSVLYVFKNDILDHKIVIDADSFLPVNSKLIPTGKLQDVLGTPFDFRRSKTIRNDINKENEQLNNGLGYDHCWALNNYNEGFRFAASAHDEISGRFLEIFTDEPGIQFYTGNFLDGTLSSKTGGNYNYRTGFCLETQHFPDSPNQKDFPSVILNPGEKYFSKTSFKFSVR